MQQHSKKYPQSFLRNTGFTLVEILVVTALILLMTTVATFNLRLGEQSLALDRAAHKVSLDVRRAMELTLRAQNLTGCVPSFSGYGLYVDEIASRTSYIIFADCNGNNKYEAGLDLIVETISLEEGIEISSIDPTQISPHEKAL